MGVVYGKIIFQVMVEKEYVIDLRDIRRYLQIFEQEVNIDHVIFDFRDNGGHLARKSVNNDNNIKKFVTYSYGDKCLKFSTITQTLFSHRLPL